jgi:hypothetical protein
MELRPGIYKHFKGLYVELIGVARHSETLEDMVVYRELKDGGLWVRPLAMFLEEVEKEGYKGPRFVWEREKE